MGERKTALKKDKAPGGSFSIRQTLYLRK